MFFQGTQCYCWSLQELECWKVDSPFRTRTGWGVERWWWWAFFGGFLWLIPKFYKAIRNFQKFEWQIKPNRNWVVQPQIIARGWVKRVDKVQIAWWLHDATDNDRFQKLVVHRNLQSKIDEWDENNLTSDKFCKS